jgi:hypothetical protein
VDRVKFTYNSRTLVMIFPVDLPEGASRKETYPSEFQPRRFSTSRLFKQSGLPGTAFAPSAAARARNPATWMFWRHWSQFEE